MGTRQHQPQRELLLESIAKRAKREPFHYRQATEWVKEDHPNTYTGATPHYSVHRDLTNSVQVEKVSQGTGVFRLVKRRSGIESKFEREHRNVLKQLRKVVRALESLPKHVKHGRRIEW